MRPQRPRRERIVYQQIMLIGHLGNDPELRTTPGGVQVASFSLAVNRTWTNHEGVRQDKTTWFRITTWRKQAEIVHQYLNKRSKVMVVGEVEESRPYTDRDGNQRASLEVTGHVIKFLSGKGEGDSGEAGDQGRGPQGAGRELRDEDIPF